MTLAARNLAVRYETRTPAGLHVVEALSELSIEVAPGRITAVAGESGSGKSTAALALAGLLPSEARVSGEVTLDDLPLPVSDDAAMSRIRGARIGLLPQNAGSALHPLMSVGAQAAETLVLHKGLDAREALEAARAILRRCGLPEDAWRKRPEALSGGQRRRAAWVVMLAADPQYVILDEPTAGQDPGFRRLLLAQVRRLRDEGRGILLITHNLAALENLADETHVLYLGEAVERMPKSPLDGRPRHPATRGLARSWPDAFGLRELTGMKGEPPAGRIHVHAAGNAAHAHEGSAHAVCRGCRFAPRCPQANDECLGIHPELKPVGDGLVRCLQGGIATRIEARRLTKRLGGVEVLSDVSLSVVAGETLVVMGESGAGKSTLGALLAGAIAPDSGEILLDGVPADRLALAQGTGWVEQDPELVTSPRMTLLEIVAEPLELSRPELPKAEVVERVRRVMREARLPDDDAFLSQRRSSLNGGALQRLALARALITDPAVLIADEPTSALDPSVQAKLLRHLLDLQTERGLTLVLITHDAGVASRTADRVLVLDAGRAVECAPARRFFRHPSSEAAQRLLEAAEQ